MIESKKNILIVDDDPKNNLIIKDLLEFEGYHVFTAENGRAGLDLIVKNPMDLVITDYEMPVMDGFELLKTLSRGYPDLPVIMLTGQYREDMDKAIATLKEGAYDYLTKPVDLSKLRRAVTVALHISQTRKESHTLTAALETAHAELNKKNEKLEELTRINNDLLTIISQDLESPLTILTGSCKLLLKEEASAPPEKQRQLVELISRQGDKILTIISDLMDLARIETDHILINKVETNLHGLIEKCRLNIQPVAGNKGITIALQPPIGIRPVYADEARMKQVIFNLIHQAILFSARNQTIRIGIIPLQNTQQVDILFRSSMVSHQDIQKVFSGDKEVPGIDKQTRYRLNLCQEIVELHQGKIWVEEGIEKETIFCLQIPNLFLQQDRK